MTARFITLEGGEGAGKSSQMARIEQWLKAGGHDVVTTREPGGTPLSEALRELLLHGGHDEMTPMAELLIVFAARAQHIEALIRPALAAGRTVLCDRFTDASFAYQGGGRGLPASVIESLETMVQGSVRPDLTFLFDVPVETGLARASGRGSEDRFETESLKFLERVRQAYRQRAEADPERMVLIDASADEETVWLRIRETLEQRLA